MLDGIGAIVEEGLVLDGTTEDCATEVGVSFEEEAAEVGLWLLAAELTAEAMVFRVEGFEEGDSPEAVRVLLIVTVLYVSFWEIPPVGLIPPVPVP